MQTVIKAFLTFAMLFVGTLILAAVKASMGTHYSTGGIGPFIIYPAVGAGIYAVWKWVPDKKGNSSDNETLKKS